MMMISHGYRATEIVEELTRAQCLELIATVPVGRIGVSLRALPVILPVNFVLVGESIVFRTIPGTKLDTAAANAIVAFQVDSYAPDGTSGWSVLVQGACSEITDPAELLAVADIPLRAWAFDVGVATRFVRIESSFVNGRRFRHR
jgi:nitroimidazol reductase NimA-like FMN-containing flavoprotein (pyridoxamine 5'-phosphate oxidase superfamily)